VSARSFRKGNVCPRAWRITKRRSLELWLIAVIGMGQVRAPAVEHRGVASPVQVNRTVPAVEPPKTGLGFPANPTVQELSRARVFEEPLVPIGGEPTPAENAALAAALLGYAKRSGPDDFASLTGFLEDHPQSPWGAALLTCLGLECYNTAHYSLALGAWRQAWSRAKDVRDARENAIISRAVSELAYMYARLGRMTELETLLESVEGRMFFEGDTEKIGGAREALWMMNYRPEVSFRCGPLALHSIRAALEPGARMEDAIFHSASTQKGFSLTQVMELSKKAGLNYQMAFRQKAGAFAAPSVVHWKVGHYAALVKQVGDRYLLQDPTFGNSVWATREALETETDGYFLIPPGDLPAGWRIVDEGEDREVWGKGVTAGNDPDIATCQDTQTASCGPAQCYGMAVSTVHLMIANLQVKDTPVGYVPPVGPPVWFTVRYNHRGSGIGIVGAKATHDWISHVTYQPANPLADVKYRVGGGGTRTFTGFDTNTQTYAFQQYDQTLLRRTGPDSFEIISPDGSKSLFTQPDNSIGSTRNVYLTQRVDPMGNAVTVSYDADLRVIALTDALGQLTTLSYGTITNNCAPPDPAQSYSVLTRVTDPFGRSAAFDYTLMSPCTTNEILVLSRITDVLGLASQFDYNSKGVIQQMTTPYGVTMFNVGNGPPTNATMRFVETRFPDSSRERVEYNQSLDLGVGAQEPVATLPRGMSTFNNFLYARNTYYWSRNACATAYGDYTKARIYHWLHTPNLTTTAGILESIKEPLEHRVWYDYDGQPAAYGVGSMDLPRHVGRVLDDGATQLHTFGYNGFGLVTNSVDPLGRALSFKYDTNGIDLVEVRQTRAENNELLFRATYNTQHRPLTTVDAASQTNAFTYNARGQILTETNPRNETTTFTYNTDGYLIAIDGPLPGTSDTSTATYDAFGRIRTLTDVSGYTLTLDYDVMDRVTRVTYPDGTFSENTYNRLHLASSRDRAGRITTFEHDNMGQMSKHTDPLGRVTLYDWCRCGDLRSLIDPMGRQTSWSTDVQGRRTAKHYADGSQIEYVYEKTTSRLLQVVDEKQQVAQYAYNPDDTLKSVVFANTTVPTPVTSYTYDTNYPRLISLTDGTGTTVFSYNPIGATPTLGAGQVASIDGPLPDDTVTYGYDELGRRTSTAINGVVSTMAYDTAGRVVGETNALGAFAYAYDGSSHRLISQSLPNGQTEERGYGGNLLDQALQRITHRQGVTPISEFIYGQDVPANRIASWSQQAEAQPPFFHTFGYDAANQLVSAAVTNAGTLVSALAYGYDAAGNRLTEQTGTTNYAATYNALNQISTGTASGVSRANEWDAQDRLVTVTIGNERTEFTYDALSRLASLRRLTNGIEASFRRLVWRGAQICEERDASGAVTKRFFNQGVKVETGPAAGSYFYTRDHLGSVREVADADGHVVNLGGPHIFSAGIANLNGTYFCTNNPATISGGTLNFNSASAVPVVHFNSGTVGGGGVLRILNQMNWLSGTMSGAGRTVIAPGATLNLANGGAVILFTRTLENGGTAIWTGAGNLSANTAVITNRPGALFEIRTAASFAGQGGFASRLDNAGTFRKTASAGTHTFAGGFSFNNYGTAEILTGTLVCGGGCVNNGAMTLSPTTTLRLAGGGSAVGSFTGPATALVEWTGGTFTLNPGAQIAGAGLYKINGGTLAFENEASVEHLDVNGVLSGNGVATVNDVMNWTSGSMSGAGQTVIATGATLNVSNVNAVTLAGGRTLENSGTVLWTGANISLGSAAVITNRAGALFETQGAGALSLGGGGGSRFDNAGTFRKSLSAGATTVAVPFSNYSTVEIQTGTLLCSSSFLNNDLVSLSAGATHRLAQGGSASGAFMAPATALVEWTGGTFTLNPGAQLNGAGLYRINGATLTCNADPTVANLDMSGPLNGTGALTASQVMNWTSGTMSGAGRTVIASGATLNVINPSALVLATRTLENGGTILWAGANIALGSAVITNRPGALFQAQNAASLSFQSGTSRFDNAGTFRKSGSLGTTTFASGVNFTNYGTVDLRSGILAANGAYGSKSGALLHCAIGGPTAGTGYGQLQVAGSVTVNGGLSVDLANGFSPALNDSFTVLTAGTRSGTFAGFSYPSNQVSMQLSNTTSSVIVQVTAVAVPPPLLLSPAISGSNVMLTWTAVSNATYRLEFNPDLNPSNWNEVPGDVTGLSNTASKLVPLIESNRFYRVRVIP
jgi:YD repeat-containing protein